MENKCYICGALDKVLELEKQLKTTLEVLRYTKLHVKQLKDKFVLQGGNIYNWEQFEYLIDNKIKEGLKLLNIIEKDITKQ